MDRVVRNCFFNFNKYAFGGNAMATSLNMLRDFSCILDDERTLLFFCYLSMT